MTGSAWLLFILGSVFTISAMALFLYAMWLGLNRNRWWPMGIVATVWVVAMAAYSLWDGTERKQMQRQRIEALSSQALSAGTHHGMLVATKVDHRSTHYWIR